MKRIECFFFMLFGFFWIVAPANMKDKVIGVATFFQDDRQCFNYQKEKFNDPDSAYLLSSKFLSEKEDKDYLKEEYLMIIENPNFDSVAEIKVMARNKMGGYVAETVYCALNNGKLDISSQHAYFQEVQIKKIKALAEIEKKEIEEKKFLASFVSQKNLEWEAENPEIAKFLRPANERVIILAKENLEKINHQKEEIEKKFK